jgi:hypothetical protein
MTSHDAGERIIDLDALHSPYAGAVRVRGVVYKVRHLDGLGYHYLQRLPDLKRGGGTMEDLDASYALALRHLDRVEDDGTTRPATRDEVYALAPGGIGHVLAIAQGMIPKVEETIPKSSARRRATKAKPGRTSQA